MSYGDPVEESIRVSLAATGIAFTGPGIPLRNFLHDGILAGQGNLAEQVQDAPERLDLGNGRGLRRVDLTKYD